MTSIEFLDQIFDISGVRPSELQVNEIQNCLNRRL